MISSATILNLLSHKKTSIAFSKGFNVIVGPTDSGKSAIIKAIKWLILNRPLGDGLRSSWGGDTSVEVVVDGKQVKRLKTDTANSYFVDELRFNAVKGDVPIEVIKALNLTELNLQTQFDSHFLLSSSSGEVAQYFNRVAHLDKIDLGLQNIQRWTREVQKKNEYNEESLATNKERLLSYVSLDEIEKRVLALEGKETARQRRIKERADLLKATDTLQSVEQELEEMSFLQQLAGHVDSLLSTFIEQRKLKNELTTLWLLVVGGKKLQQEEEELNQTLEKYETQFHKALGKGSLCPLCGSVIK